MRVTRVVPLVVALASLACAHGRVPVGTVASGKVTPEDAVDAYLKAEVDLLLASSGEALEHALLARNQAESKAREVGVDGSEAGHVPEAMRQRARQVALVAILVRRSVSEQEARQMAVEYEGSDPFLTRHLGMQVLAMCDEETATRSSRELTTALLRESNDAIRRTGLSVAARIRVEDAVVVLDEYVRTGSPSLARYAYSVAWSRGRDMACELRSRVAKRGKGGGLESLEQVEAWAGQRAIEAPAAGCPDGTRVQE